MENKLKGITGERLVKGGAIIAAIGSLALLVAPSAINAAQEMSTVNLSWGGTEHKRADPKTPHSITVGKYGEDVYTYGPFEVNQVCPNGITPTADQDLPDELWLKNSKPDKSQGVVSEIVSFGPDGSKVAWTCVKR